MKFRSYAVLFFLLCLTGACNRSFEHSSKGMQQLNKVLEDKFGADAWYSSVTLVHDGAGDDMITVERATLPDKIQQEQWIWFHGFWEKKADISLQFSGIRPGDLLFQLHKGANLLQLGQLIEKALQELSSDAMNGKCRLVMAGIRMGDPKPTQLRNLFYTVQLKTAAGVSYNYTYDEQGQKLPPAQP